jgi:hypothetical protein
MVRTVRIVAIHAVLADRQMVPQEGAAFIGMAGVAGGVDRRPFERFGGRLAVSAMAAAACHFSVEHRHMFRPLYLRGNSPVALGAKLLLGGFLQKFLCRHSRVDTMALRA